MSQIVVIEMDRTVGEHDPDVSPFITLLDRQPKWIDDPDNVREWNRQQWRFALSATASEMTQRYRDRRRAVRDMREFAHEADWYISMDEASAMLRQPRDPSPQINWLEDELILPEHTGD